jgi:ABC-type transport system substrate-binding protein
MHALDRTEMANVMTLGLGSTLDSWVLRNTPEFKDVSGSIVTYPYDPRRAGDIIQSLGYSRGADGMFRDGSGSTITLEVRTLAADYNQRTTLAVVDYLRRSGVDASIVTIPPQRQGDAEYRSTFPGFQILLGSPAPTILHSSRAGVPANNFQPNQNYPRYMQPDYDALSDRYYSTIPWNERMDVLRQIVHRVSDEVLVLPLFEYQIPVLIGNRIQNVIPGSTWNAHEWDVSS